MIGVKSSIPVSCFQIESTILPISINTAWGVVKNFQLDQIAPDIVTGVTYVSGGEGQVGSGITVCYKSGDVWELRVTEFSERHHILSYEITATEPPISVTSV